MAFRSTVRYRLMMAFSVTAIVWVGIDRIKHSGGDGGLLRAVGDDRLVGIGACVVVINSRPGRKNIG